jgi:acylphosphatase
MECLHVEVVGRVQGVGFRWFVVETAKRLDLSGWVRNNSDGKVEVAAAGSADAISRLDAALRTGPRGARIDDVKALAPLPPDALPRPFEILR